MVANLTDANSHATNFSYDGFDRLATATYPLGSTEAFTYDVDNNILTRNTRAGQTITLTYDTLNRIKTKAPPSPAPVVTYTYDIAGHLTSAQDNSTAITAATPPSGMSVQYTTSYIYDVMNRPTAVNWTPAAAQAATAASSVSFSHTYNKANQRIGQTVTDNAWLNYPSSTPSATSYTANALNQYTAVGAVTPSYDSNGNLTSDGTFTLGYDAENRLTSANGAGNASSYTFDAQGRRKTKTINGSTTVFVTAADNREVLEYDGVSGAIQRWYAYGPGPNAVLSQANVAASTRATLLPDTLGSIIGSLDSASGALTKIGYLPYGKNVTAPGAFGFTGQRVDAEIGSMYYFRARHYSSTWGRFLQADPIGYNGGTNLYAYVGNDPLNRIDPFGLFWGQQIAITDDYGRVIGDQSMGQATVTAGTFVVGTGAGLLAASALSGVVAVTGEVVVTGETTASAEILIPQIGSKLEYILGNAGGSAYNVQRSTSMASQLTRIGLQDTAATRDYLTQQLIKVLNDPSSVSAIESGGNAVREFILTGPGGAVKIQTIWQNTKLITFFVVRS